MAPNNHEPSERSPLLAKSGDSIDAPAKPVDTSEPTTPNDVEANGTYSTTTDGSQDAEDANGTSASSNGTKPKTHEGMPEIRAKMHWIFPALGIGVLLSAADQTIIVSSYGQIGTDLKALNNTSWIATAYFLTLTSFQPLFGKLSDIFGRRPCILFGYAVFGLGCLFCGLAQDIEQLIAARAFAGIGGGGMTTVVSILLSDIIPLRERGQWQGYINIIYATGASIGAPLGGLLADTIGWRWAFLGQAPLCLVAFIAVSTILKLPKKDDSHWKEKLRRIDFLGALVLICAVFALLVGLDRGSNVSWKDPATIGSLAAALPLFIIFVAVELKVAAEPFAPGRIIFERSLFACYLCNFFSFAGWLAAIFYIPLFLQTAVRFTATQAGLALIPASIAGVSGSLFAGFYMRRSGKYYWVTVIGYSCLVLGQITILLFSGVITTNYWVMIVGMCVNGFSNGIGVTTTLIGLIANASHEDLAVATAISYLFRSLGSVTGVSLSAAVANQALRMSLTSELGSGKEAVDIANRVRESLAYIKQLEPSVRAIVIECYARSTRAAFGFQIGLVFGAALFAWFIREKALSR